MRIHLETRPWDLYICFLYVAVMTLIVVLSNVGDPATVALLIFVPGYLVVAALFPEKNEVNWIERLALSLGLSVVLSPLIGLALDLTPFYIGRVSIVVAIALLAALAGTLAHVRRAKLPREDRLTATVDISFANWKNYGIFDKATSVILAASIIIAASALVFVIVQQRPPEAFTEFYILGPGGNASGYPTNLTVNETGSVILGVANHEEATINYTVRIDLVGVRIVYNATSGFNETVEVNRTNWSTLNVTLVDRENWTQSYTFWISATGLWKVQFFLFKAGDFVFVYRELHLYVRVT